MAQMAVLAAAPRQERGGDNYPGTVDRMKELHPNLDRDEFYEKTILHVRNISENDDKVKEKDVL